MATTTAFQVLFEASIKKLEKRVAGPTVNVVREVLANAGMDEGEWSLRDSRRIKKKGRDRFHAIRIEERGGRKSIRIWCKPCGNDSCFEYSLLPPEEVDVQALFELIRRTHPVNLEIPESEHLPKAFIRHVIDSKPSMGRVQEHKVDSEKNKSVEPAGTESDEALKESETSASKSEEFGDRERQIVVARFGFDLHQIRDPASVTVESADQKSPMLSRKIAETVSATRDSVASRMGAIGDESLVIDEPVLMSDQEVMDKALLAISLVAPVGYARKTEASNSIIDRLGIKRFVGEVSGGTYTSVEGAMRALTMALRSAGYLERVHYTAGDGSVSRGIKGYKLTPRATKRISALRSIRNPRHSEMLKETRPYCEIGTELDGTVLSVESDGAYVALDGGGIGFISNENQESESSEGMTHDQIGFDPDNLSRLKSLIAAHEEADVQLKEIDVILGNLDSEIADIQLDATGLELAEREKTRHVEVLQGEIQRIREKKSSVAVNLQKKHKEKKEWEDMKSPHLSERSKIEAEICAITGRNKK